MGKQDGDDYFDKLFIAVMGWEPRLFYIESFTHNGAVPSAPLHQTSVSTETEHPSSVTERDCDTIFDFIT